MGAGVTPSRVDAQIQSVSWKKSLEEKLEANCKCTKLLEQILFNWSVQGSPICVNDLCEVLDWEGTGLVVARGKISSVDLTIKVHGYNLGPDCYRVVVEEAVVPRAEFYRPQPEFSAMEDAIGSTIAWPTKYIVPL
ncbi:hypothetical protein ACLB2K_030047 [Fragaria x ananassa]